MTAGELALVLAHVDPDLPVTIKGRHIMTVDRTSRRLDPYPTTTYPRIHPAGVQLGTMVNLETVGWWKPAPPFTLTGAFRRRRQLDEQLGRI